MFCGSLRDKSVTPSSSKARRRALAKQAGQPPVLEDPAPRLAARAVEDRVLVVVDLGERRAAARARLAEAPVHSIDRLVARAALARLQAPRELRVDRVRQSLDLFGCELRRQRER